MTTEPNEHKAAIDKVVQHYAEACGLADSGHVGHEYPAGVLSVLMVLGCDLDEIRRLSRDCRQQFVFTGMGSRGTLS